MSVQYRAGQGIEPTACKPQVGIENHYQSLVGVGIEGEPKLGLIIRTTHHSAGRDPYTAHPCTVPLFLYGLSCTEHGVAPELQLVTAKDS